MSLLRAIATVGGLTLVSRVLGFFRDVLIARVLGAGIVADAFFVALILPNTFRRLFGEGAFSTAFVPMFARLLAGDGRAVARVFAEQAQALLTAALLVLVVAAILVMEYIVPAIAPGFGNDPAKLAVAVAFARATFPYLLLICLVALLGGVLNALDRFAAMAATPILFNLTLIVVLLAIPLVDDPTADPDRDLRGAGAMLAWGVSLSGVLQFGFMVWQCRRAGFPVGWRLPRWSRRMRDLGWLMLPAMGAHGVMQINLLVGTMLASLLPTGAISYLYYADRINQLPLGVVGVAVATALLPKLSIALRKGEDAAAADHLNRSLEISLLLAVPAAAALAVIAGPIVDGLFRRGAFTQADSVATAAALTVFATGLPAFVLVKVLSTGFFAREDTATPFRIGVVAMVANIGLGALLMQAFAHVGLAAATSIAGWINAGLLGLLLFRRGLLPLDPRLKRRFGLILVAASVMVACLVAARSALLLPSDAGGAARLGALLAMVGGGALVYGVTCQVTGAARIGELRRMVKRDGGPGGSPSAAAPGMEP